MAVKKVIRKTKVDNKEVAPTYTGMPTSTAIGRFQSLVDKLSSLDAVEGLNNAIELQRKRVAKLTMWENQLPYTLDQLTIESRLLKDMYVDILRYQTNAAVLKQLQQRLDHAGITTGLVEYSMNSETQAQIQAATLDAIKLLSELE